MGLVEEDMVGLGYTMAMIVVVLEVVGLVCRINVLRSDVL